MKLRKSKFTQGFTIIEMVVALSIVGLIVSVVLYDYSSYNDKQMLSSVTQELSLAIRETQNYALNVKESGVGTGKFNYPYGILFSMDNNSGDNSKYVLYSDYSPTDGDYDKGGGCGSNPSECIYEVPLRGGIKVESVCSVADNNAETCPPVSGTDLVYLNITFVRPNPEAKIKFTRNPGGGNSLTGFKRARVKLISPKGKRSSITIEETGQVYVQ